MSYNELALMRGDGISLYGNYHFKHPTIGQIADLSGIEGNNEYNNFVTALTMRPTDIADILWSEFNIWWKDIKDEWQFFLERSTVDGKVIEKNKKYEDGRKTIPAKTKTINTDISDALCFFTDVQGTYVLAEDEHKNLVIANVHKENEHLCYYYPEKDFIFKQHHYEISRRFLQKINWTNREDYMHEHGGNKRATIYILENEYNNRMDDLKKKRKPTVTLESIISSLIAKGISVKEVWDLPIYMIYELYYRFLQFENWNTTTLAFTAGNIDTKKYPINWEKINWAKALDKHTI